MHNLNVHLQTSTYIYHNMALRFKNTNEGILNLIELKIFTFCTGVVNMDIWIKCRRIQNSQFLQNYLNWEIMIFLILRYLLVVTTNCLSGAFLYKQKSHPLFSVCPKCTKLKLNQLMHMLPYRLAKNSAVTWQFFILKSFFLCFEMVKPPSWTMKFLNFNHQKQWTVFLLYVKTQIMNTSDSLL
jgi:hypothetical protein